MNESVYKSPKWLKKYFDYELTTGDDIAGRREERERIERQRESERQKEIDKENVAKKLKAQIEKELADLYQHIINDFSGSPYIDKIHTTKEGGEVALNYTFENGDKLKICGDEITYGGSIYTVGLLWRNKFIGLGNEMIDKATKRSSGKSTPKSSTTSGNKYSSHPKGNLYQTLKDTVKQREAQLSKMKKGDPDRSSMENELDAAKRKLKEMKDRYQFEHLNSFEMYNEHYMRNTLLEKEIVVNGVNFDIKYDELKEILYEITDEFTKIEFEIEETQQSGIILSDPNSFMVLLYEKGQHRWPPVLYYLEPKIFDLISNVNDKLGRYNLEVFFSDFSSSDDFYEIVITKKGNKPKMNPQRYIQDGNGEWKYKS